MKLFKRFFLTPFLAMSFMAGLAACTYNSTTHTASFSTEVLAKDAATVQVVLKNLETIPAVAEQFSKDPAQKAQFDALVTQVNTLSSQIAASTGGSVSVNVGSTWASSLAGELQTALNIATPIAGAVGGPAATYLSVASQLVPVIEMLVTTFGAEPQVPAAPVAVATATENPSYGAAPTSYIGDVLRAQLLVGIPK